MEMKVSDIKTLGKEGVAYNLVGVALAAVAAVSFSLRSIFVKLAYEDMHDPVTLLALRMIFALPFFVIALVIHYRFTDRSSSIRISSRDIGVLLGLGFVGYYLSSLLDMIGLQFVSAGVGRLLLFIYPTIVVIISTFALGKKPTLKEIAALAITYVGVSLVLSNNYGGNNDDFWFGATIIIASAMSFSLYLVGSGEIVAKVGTVRFTAYATMAACMFCVLHFLAFRSFSALVLPPRVYVLVVAMSVFSTVMPIFMMAEALRRIGASRVAMTSALGPIATVIAGNLGLDERMTLLQSLGAALVISGVVLVTVQPRKTSTSG
jgi:drug/metabolite transporter (DMT)-like permease